MRLKSFYANTMTEAMKMVRDSLGENAVIVATRDEQGGRAVRVTAAVDPSDYNESEFNESLDTPNFETHDRAKPSGAQDWLQYDDEQDEQAVAEEITDAMLRHAVPEDVMDQVLSCATIIGFDQASAAMIAAVEHLFHFAPLPDKAYKKPIMFVGAPGSGKTLAAAKLAARGVMDGLNIGVVSCDTIRAGGIEQLKNFTNLLRVDLQTADSPQQLSQQIQRLRACHQIIIDTPAVNPFDKHSVKELVQLISCEDIEPVLVMPAGIDAEESGEIARVFATIGVQRMMPTRIDIARRLGGILSAAHHGAMAFTDASNTPKVADGFYSLNPKNLSTLLMPDAFRSTGKSVGRSSQTDTPRTRSKTGLYQ